MTLITLDPQENTKALNVFKTELARIRTEEEAAYVEPAPKKREGRTRPETREEEAAHHIAGWSTYF